MRLQLEVTAKSKQLSEVRIYSVTITSCTCRCFDPRILPTSELVMRA
jgi:hypothetical protein